MPLDEGTFTVSASTTTYVIGSSSTTTGGSGIVIWQQWIESSASTTAGDGNWYGTNYYAVHGMNQTSTNQVWDIWAGSNAESVLVHQHGSFAGAAIMHPPPAQPRLRVSPEERARQQAREAELNRRYEAEKAARIVAEKKAEVLLAQMLTAEQKRDLKKNNHFYLHSGGKKYRIDRGRTGNVKLVNERHEVIESYCIHPSIACPDADTMLAQKLLIETDLEKFERVANISAVGRGGRNSYGRGMTG